MNHDSSDEARRLARHWNGMGAAELDRYLVQEVEHPALNPQSILIRAFLIDRLFPGQGTELVEEETYFAACACHALLGIREGWFPRLRLLLKKAPDHAELPGFLRGEMRERWGGRLDLLDLLDELNRRGSGGFDDFHCPFEEAWRAFLETRGSSPCKLLELACGSANDYRFLTAYGIGRFLDYTGVDISSENIRNAKRRFPEIDFRVGDAAALDLPDRSFDVVFAFDLFEHLSADGLEKALRETLRVAVGEVWISLFNAGNVPEHDIRPVDDYHWNLLSLSRLVEVVESAGFEAGIIPVARELERRFPGYRHYNPEAHILMAKRGG